MNGLEMSDPTENASSPVPEEPVRPKSKTKLTGWPRLPGAEQLGGRRGQSPLAPHHIQLNLREIDQLFNTMDPSPFHEKDLDHDAEEFILSWAQEFHRTEPVDLVIHLEKVIDQKEMETRVAEAVHNYFAYRARLNQLEFKRLMKQGRLSLLVGMAFLLICFISIELLALDRSGPSSSFIKEGLTIAGWVAMWRPLQIYLYEWWPLLRRGHIFEKLSRMPVHLRSRAVGKS